MAASRGFVSSIYPLEVLGLTVPGYAALYSVIANFAVAVVLSPVLDRLWPQAERLDQKSDSR
jgi:SSS family solute:Na+ symporter